jgi:hypothetical protein
MERECRHCVWGYFAPWFDNPKGYESDEARLECRRFPPSQAVAESHGESTDSFPTVLAVDWCSEFKAFANAGVQAPELSGGSLQ